MIGGFPVVHMGLFHYLTNEYVAKFLQMQSCRHSLISYRIF